MLGVLNRRAYCECTAIDRADWIEVTGPRIQGTNEFLSSRIVLQAYWLERCMGKLLEFGLHDSSGCEDVGKDHITGPATAPFRPVWLSW
jgi:hypothetical protein